jgi:hypothetical protein
MPLLQFNLETASPYEIARMDGRGFGQTIVSLCKYISYRFGLEKLMGLMKRSIFF